MAGGRMKAGVGLLALALTACGGPDAPSGVRPDRCDFHALEACVVVEGEGDLRKHIDAEHVERQLRMALDYWGAPKGALAGWAIVFVDGQPICNGSLSSGCT